MKRGRVVEAIKADRDTRDGCVAARKAGAKRFHTLNLGDFLSFHRPGDPEILPP